MENFRIESLEINKIGAFEHIKMDFPKKTDPDKAEIHILTGENGTGKSTVLMLLASIADKSNDKNIYKRHHQYMKVGFSLLISENKYVIKLNKYSKSIVFRRRLDGNTEELVDEIVSNRLQIYEDETDELVGFAFFAYSGNRFTKSELINTSEYEQINPFINAVDFLTVKDSKSFLTWILSNKTKALIDFSNGGKLGESKYDKTINKIEGVISDIIGTKIQFVLHSKPNVHVAIKLNDVLIDIDTLPDGIKSIISWLGDLIMRLDYINWGDFENSIFEQNIILFLDEIEVHLHPAWQRKILPVVQKLFKNAQIFISTHSPFVVGSVDGAWVHKLKKGDDGFAVLDGEPVLSEDGKSVRRILDEVFGINQQYGIEVEKDLARFREIRQQIMMGQTYNSEEFNDLVKHLASQSTELEQMMGMEMNQLKRISQKELV